MIVPPTNVTAPNSENLTPVLHAQESTGEHRLAQEAALIGNAPLAELAARVSQESIRSNGKMLIAPDRALATLLSLEDSNNGFPREKSLTGDLPVACKVDAAMRITYQGWFWSVLQLPGACVGGLVQVLQVLPSGALIVSAESEQLPSTLASPIEPAHSHPHKCPPLHNCASLGSCSTDGGPAHQYACPAPHAGCTPQMPPVAMPLVRMQPHSDDTAHAAPACDSTANEQVAPPGLSVQPLPCKTSSDIAMVGCGLPVVVVKIRRFRPLASSKLNGLIVSRFAVSKLIFVLHRSQTGGSNV